MFDSFDPTTENNSTEKKFTLYCGPMMFRPILINPTRKQLNEFLDSDKKTDEIEYYSLSTIKEEEVDSLRISIWGYLTLPDGKEVKHVMDPIWLKNKTMISTKDPSNPKTCYLNSFGRNFWTPNKEFPEYYYSDQIREAIYGEQQLMDFILNFMGINTYYDTTVNRTINPLPNYITEGSTFLKIDELFSKDYSSIQALFDKFANESSSLPDNNPNKQRKVTALAIVKARTDTGELVQGLYTGKFGRVRKNKDYKIVASDIKQILKEVESEGDYLKHVGIISDTLVEFNPDTPTEEAVSYDF